MLEGQKAAISTLTSAGESIGDSFEVKAGSLSDLVFRKPSPFRALYDL